MKKISNLAGIVAAAALLCGISACDNSETITMTSAKIEMVGDPIVTDKAAIFQWKSSVANGEILITRQAPDEEEVTIAETSSNVFVDRVTYSNLLKAGVEYTYRFYNINGVSSARTTETTLEMKYGCVERKVTFPSIAPAGTKLDPITEEQVKVVTSELNGHNYVSVYVDEKESGVWMNINGEGKYDDRIGGIEGFIYDASAPCIIWVGKWWPGDSKWNDYEGAEGKRFYDNSDTGIRIDLAATKNNYLSFDVDEESDSFKLYWSGEKDSKYEVSFEAFDNQGNAVALKKSTVAAADIKNDAFNNYEVTGKLSTLIDTTKPTTVKTAKAILKETAKDGTVSESEDEEIIYDSFTTYTRVYDRLYISKNYDYDENGYPTYKSMNVILSGSNLPATAKLYYKQSGDKLYTEVKDGLKKAEGSDFLTATVSLNKDNSYDFKAVVTMDNAKWYDWEEGKTDETSTGYYTPSSNDWQ